jgi:hypothetical protein
VSANRFMYNLAWRMANRIQLTTDAHRPYYETVYNAFRGDVDYAQLMKAYGKDDKHPEKRYSPSVLLCAIQRPMIGRPPKQPVVLYKSFQYQAASWDKARCVVAKIERHSGELFPRMGFIVTNLRWKSSNVVKFYNKRGTAEQWIKEGKYALNWTRLSCHDFVDNQVWLQLFSLAYNLGNFLRRLALLKTVKDWSLRILKEKLIKNRCKSGEAFEIRDIPDG